LFPPGYCSKNLVVILHRLLIVTLPEFDVGDIELGVAGQIGVAIKTSSNPPNSCNRKLIFGGVIVAQALL